MFYLTTHSTHFIYGYMATEIYKKSMLVAGVGLPLGYVGLSWVFKLVIEISVF